MTQKKSPPKREIKKQKVVEHGLTASKVVKDKVELKPHQKPVANFLREQDISVVIADAGCAKDFVQMYRAIEGLKNKEFDRIIICKPIVEASKSIGYMPGTLSEKTDMYLQSFYDAIDKIVGKENANSIKAKVQFEHVGFQRGNTFPEFSCVIVSELQNLTASEAHTYITRLPQSSKMFLNADAIQSDLGMKSGLNDFLESISGVDNCAIAILDGEKHQMRRKEIIEITKKYIEIQKRKGKVFELDRSRFEYIEL
jgi:phosphate starvation-inducible PhoH-like protein